MPANSAHGSSGSSQLVRSLFGGGPSSSRHGVEAASAALSTLPPVATHPDPDAARRVATDIARALASHGHIAYFAGGCVRDALLGLAPTDFDIATGATPDRVQAL